MSNIVIAVLSHPKISPTEKVLCTIVSVPEQRVIAFIPSSSSTRPSDSNGNRWHGIHGPDDLSPLALEGSITCGEELLGRQVDC